MESVDVDEVQTLLECEGLHQLVCPSVEEQGRLWREVTVLINDENLGKLLQSIGYSFVSIRPFTESEGIVNRIYLVQARDDKGVQKDLILKVLNPEPRFIKRKTNEAALIDYLKTHTTIPVPNVLSYSNEPQKSILKCRYILMEKTAGRILKDVLPKKAAGIPVSLINKVFDVIKQLKTLKPFKQELLGCFEVDESTNEPVLIPFYPKEKLYADFFESWDYVVQVYIREMRKLITHRRIADLFDEKRLLLKATLQQVRENNPSVDLSDQFYVTHGDLNDTNILVDPETLEINCIIDWEWMEYNISSDLTFGEDWYQDDLEESAYVQKLIKSALALDENRELYLDSAKNSMTFFKEYLNRITTFGFCSCNFFYFIAKEPSGSLLQNAKHMIYNRNRLEESLQNFDVYMKNAFNINDE